MTSKKLLLLNILLALAITGALARLATDFISYRLSHAFPSTTNKQTTPLAPVAEDLLSFSPIMGKGLFGKATKGALTPVIQSKGPQEGGVSTSDLILVGTALGSYRDTFALVMKTSTQEERVFRLGEKVFGVGPLVAVKKERAYLSVNGKRVELLTPTTPAESGKPGQHSQSQMAAPVGSSSFVVDQRALNAALDNIGQAMTDARLLPSVKEGKVEGFRASEVKPAGIFGMVGIRNGDVLLRINDFPIDSPEKAIQSFVSLKGQSRIKLDLVRDGQPVTMNYEIR
ncbi:MAG: general secretion pathway protein GspC [Geobacter sp.]|nr:general secretion pathway protein GspC [Geobacter sp.]